MVEALRLRRTATRLRDLPRRHGRASGIGADDAAVCLTLMAAITVASTITNAVHSETPVQFHRSRYAIRCFNYITNLHQLDGRDPTSAFCARTACR